MKWVLRIKEDIETGKPKFKARLVARGFSQLPGIDFTDTYSPVANYGSIRLIIAIAALKGYSVLQFDVRTAFLHGDLKEKIVVEIPEGVRKDDNQA